MIKNKKSHPSKLCFDFFPSVTIMRLSVNQLIFKHFKVVVCSCVTFKMYLLHILLISKLFSLTKTFYVSSNDKTQLTTPLNLFIVFSFMIKGGRYYQFKDIFPFLRASIITIIHRVIFNSFIYFFSLLLQYENSMWICSCFCLRSYFCLLAINAEAS